MPVRCDNAQTFHRTFQQHAVQVHPMRIDRRRILHPPQRIQKRGRRNLQKRLQPRLLAQTGKIGRIHRHQFVARFAARNVDGGAPVLAFAFLIVKRHFAVRRQAAQNILKSFRRHSRVKLFVRLDRARRFHLRLLVGRDNVNRIRLRAQQHVGQNRIDAPALHGGADFLQGFQKLVPRSFEIHNALLFGILYIKKTGGGVHRPKRRKLFLPLFCAPRRRRRRRKRLCKTMHKYAKTENGNAAAASYAQFIPTI